MIRFKNMIFKSQSIITVLAAIIMILPCSCKKQEPAEAQKNSLTVQATVGDVTVTTDGKDRTPATGEEISENSIIKTGKASLMDAKFAEAGAIRINEKTVVLVSQLTDDTLMQLKKGKIFVMMSKLKKEQQFKVKTSTTVAAIRGTSFRVSAGKKKSRVDVLAGTVRVNPVKEGKVIEDIEQVVEKNTAVELDVKTVDRIVKKKQEIKVTEIQPETFAEIKKEVKNIAIDEKVSEKVKDEVKEVGIESTVVDLKPSEKLDDETKGDIEGPDDADKTIDSERDRLKKKKAEREEREALKKKKDEEGMARIQKEREEKDRAAREEKERIEKERKEKERKEKEKMEQRVKNIPTL